MRSMAMRSMAALAVAVCTATSVPAHASETTQHTQSRPDAKPASESARWYGWQIAIFDAAALALAIAGSSTDSDPLFYSGIGVYLVVPPAIHAVQDEGDGDGDGDSKRKLIGTMLFVSAVDIAVFSWKW